MRARTRMTMDPRNRNKNDWGVVVRDSGLGRAGS